MKLITVMVLVLVLATAAFAVEKSVFQMKKDFGGEQLGDCYMGYYYFVPCPTSSYFFGWTFDYGDIVGQFFCVGDPEMGSGTVCDPNDCQSIDRFVVLDFNDNAPGMYPQDFQVEYDIYCSDLDGCPIGPALWNSGMVTSYQRGWNWFDIDPPLSVCPCVLDPPGGPVFLITGTVRGDFPEQGPQWGSDGPGIYYYYCASMHDVGCLTVLYPRPTVSYYTPGIHSGYYGNPDSGTYQCPPQLLAGFDTTPDLSQWGAVEWAWTVDMTCSGPTATEPTTWGNIKSMYK
jgi:hypothetical protein